MTTLLLVLIEKLKIDKVQTKRCKGEKKSDSVKTENESVKEGDEIKVEVLSDTDSIPEEPDNLIYRHTYSSDSEKHQ